MTTPRLLIRSRNAWYRSHVPKPLVKHRNNFIEPSIQSQWNNVVPIAKISVSKFLVEDRLIASLHFLPCMEVQVSYNSGNPLYDCSMYENGDIVIRRGTHAIGTVQKSEQQASGLYFCYLEVSWLGSGKKSYLYPNQLIRVQYKRDRLITEMDE